MTKPYTIGITGGSGSGKTYFLTKLSQRFGADEICFISQDNYYHPRDRQQTDDRGVKNFDLPEAIDFARFAEDIRRLKRGEIVTLTEYTFNNPKTTPKNIIYKPAPILVIEGLFVQYFPEIRQELDLKIFIEAKDYLKLSRRIKRDNEERGYDLEDVLYRYHYHVMPVYERLIEPLKHQADLIIPNNHHFEAALEVLTWALKARIAENG
ncbi:MAG: uridine kinase [Cyclobacteriaceae bacterium]|nr:uridine kinase [Cyclobacteriaceae bacterium]MCX7637276.1 uridine kinase [Cyclobacteriaceae bacterium]MDW8331267.1 uridine kinase [Cyclobacteriaceae bacterium]